MDPRTWDLKQLLAAWEVQLQRSVKDASEWERLRQQLYAPLEGLRKPRGGRVRVPGDGAAAPPSSPTTGRPGGRGLAAGDVEAMLARMAIADASYR